MKIIFGGVRGSFPVSGNEFIRFGGETTSVLVEGPAGERILVDLGTGARRLGDRMMEQGVDELTVLFTHFHLDHLAGLPMLPQLYRKQCRIHFRSPRHGGFEVEQVLSQLMAQPYWPLQMEELASRRSFQSLPPESAEPLTLGGIEIRWCGVPHEGGSTAYRFDEPETGASFVFATDMEWPQAGPGERDAFLRLLREPAPVRGLAMDGQYSEEEYATHRSWGHTPWGQAVDMARDAGVGGLWITHHDPARTDLELDRIQAEVNRDWALARLARQGEVVAL